MKHRAETIKFLKWCKKRGLRVKILTAREDLEPVAIWVVNQGLGNLISGVTNKKESALIYIDDRAYRFNGDWKNESLPIMSTISYHEQKSLIA